MARTACGRRPWALLAVIALGALLAACGRGGAPAPGGGGGAQGELPPLSPEEVLRIAEDGAPSGAGFYIADARGYFKELGLKVEFVDFESSAYMLPALAAGQVDVAGGIVTTSLLNAVERGLPIRIVADKGRNIPGKSYFDMVIRKDLVGEIKTLADLRGRRIAVTAPGSVDELFADLALKKGGLTKDDVEYVFIKSFGDMNAALANGAVDAAMHIEPLITAGEDMGILDRWIDATEWAPDFQVAMVLSSPKFIDERSEAAKRFMVAYLKGLRDYHEAFHNGKDLDQIIDIMTRYTALKDKALWRKVHVVGLNPDGYVNMTSIDEQIKWYRDMGYYSGKLTAADLVDHSLVDFALQRLGHHPAGEPAR